MSAIKSCICWLVIVGLTTMNMGCGAILGGSRQTVQVDSNPPGASVTITPTGTTQATPTAFSLERRQNYVLVFEKEGYEIKKFEVQRGVRGGIVVLDVLFGLLPLIVDAATGSWYGLSPKNVNVTMVKKAGTSLDLPDIIRVSLSVEEVTEEAYHLQVRSDVPGVRVHILAAQGR